MLHGPLPIFPGDKSDARLPLLVHWILEEVLSQPMRKRGFSGAVTSAAKLFNSITGELERKAKPNPPQGLLDGSGSLLAKHSTRKARCRSDRGSSKTGLSSAGLVPISRCLQHGSVQGQINEAKGNCLDLGLETALKKTPLKGPLMGALNY